MATAGRQPSPPLNRAIFEQFGRFDAFQLVRLLLHRGDGVGSIASHLRFRADLRAGFPGHEITRVERTSDTHSALPTAKPGESDVERIELRTPNYCLASELGSLPEPFLEWVRDQERVGGHAMAAFLDVFNQRLHVLRHELKQRSLRALDPASPGRSRYAGQLAAIVGVAFPAQQRQIPLPLRAWLGMSSSLANSSKSAAVVSRILTGYLGVVCRLREMVGSWREIEGADRIALGRQRHALGRQSLLGRRAWDARAAVRLEVDQMNFEACCALLPLRATRRDEAQPKAAHAGLVALIRVLLDRRFDCHVSIEIDSASVPPSQLHLPWREGGVGLRLGQTAWLGRHRGRRVSFTIRAHDEGQVA